MKKWIQSLLSIFQSTRRIDPPGYEYLKALAKAPYIRGVRDCSNKATAYLQYLLKIGVPAKYVRATIKGRGHALVQYERAGELYWADATNGTFGWWADFPYTLIGVYAYKEAEWDPEFSTAGITYQDYEEGRFDGLSSAVS